MAIGRFPKAETECCQGRSAPSSMPSQWEVGMDFSISLAVWLWSLAAEDLKVWNGGGRAAFLQEIDLCGQRCMGRALCAAKCMAKRGYSQDTQSIRKSQPHWTIQPMHVKLFPTGPACADCFGGSPQVLTKLNCDF